MNNELNKIPESTSGDKVLAVSKVLIDLIPMVGSSANDIIAMIITPPLQKRKDEWIKSIAEELIKIKEKVEGFKLEDLQNNETFVTTFMHATQTAIRNHQKEKLEALRNAVLNSTKINAPDEDLQLIFINLIDSLTQWHLRILKFFDDPKKWGNENGISYPEYSAGSPLNLLEIAFPELKSKKDFTSKIISDLNNSSLMDGSVSVIMTVNGMYSSKTKKLGKQFLEFITYNK